MSIVETRGRKPFTVGEASVRLSRKSNSKHSAVDQMREQLTDYDKNVHQCIKENRNFLDDVFYVVALTKKERLMPNVIRGYFFARMSCPTPDYDQVVYRYTKSGDHLEFLWVVPSIEIVNYMKSHRSKIPASQYSLLENVLKFTDGTLLRLAKQENNEKRDSNILED